MKPMEVFVLVPRSRDTPISTLVAPRTALVTPVRSYDEHEFIAVWYEEPGDAVNVVTFEDRITQAAGRFSENYPTSKMTGVAGNEVVIGAIATREVGNGWYISHVIDRSFLEEWAGEPIIEGGSANFIRRRVQKGLLRDGQK